MIQIYIIIATVIVSSAAGYKARSIVQDSRDLAIIEKKEEFKANESSTAKAVIELLQERDKNVQVITKWKTKFIDKPVYINKCIDDDGMQYIESLSSNNPRITSSKLPDEITKP